ncbi:hypothetical protein [Pedobacter rhodius]|uniref:Uncharacterized protein n=1 Tax=Pedobacter rhodius TaxID=3004098 RepID=A0ABT4L1B5_9SPHI|nr:hypothetical protein [Pedobacter sp. SJ11]MCZ4224845.1 hypothetical protein [Pedobacter sp. SJ11]
MKKPAITLTKKTVFVYKSVKTTSDFRATKATDPLTNTTTITVSSAVCIDY